MPITTTLFIIIIIITTLLLVSAPSSFSAATSYDFSSYNRSNFTFPEDFMTFITTGTSTSSSSTPDEDPRSTLRNSEITIENLYIKTTIFVIKLNNAISLRFTNTTCSALIIADSMVDDSKLRIDHSTMAFIGFQRATTTSSGTTTGCCQYGVPWLNSSVLQIDHNRLGNGFLPVKKNSSTGFDELSYSFIIGFQAHISGQDKSEILIQNNIFNDNDWNTHENMTKSEKIIGAFVALGSSEKYCCDKGARTYFNISGCKRIDVSNNVMHDRVLKDFMIYSYFERMNNVQTITMNNNHLTADYGSAFAFIKVMWRIFENSAVSSSSSSSSAAIISSSSVQVSDNVIIMKELNINAVEARNGLTVTIRTFCSGIEVKADERARYNDSVIIRNLGKLHINNNTISFLKFNDYEGIDLATAGKLPAGMSGVSSCFYLSTIRFEFESDLPVNNETRTSGKSVTAPPIVVDSGIEGLNSFQFNRNNIFIATMPRLTDTYYTQEHSSWLPSAIAIDIASMLTIRNCGVIEISENRIEASSTERTMRHLYVRLFGVIDFDSVVSRGNVVTTSRVGTHATLIEVRTATTMQPAFGPSNPTHENSLGWRHGKSIIVSDNILSAPNCNEGNFIGIDFGVRHIDNVDSIRIENNTVTVRGQISTLDPYGDSEYSSDLAAVGIRRSGLLLQGAIRNVKEGYFVLDNNISMMNTLVPGSDLRKADVAVSNTPISLLIVPYGTGLGSHARATDFPWSENIANIDFRRNYLEQSHVGNKHVGTQVGCFFFYLTYPTRNVGTLSVENNFCAISEIQECPGTGCNGILFQLDTRIRIDVIRFSFNEVTVKDFVEPEKIMHPSRLLSIICASSATEALSLTPAGLIIALDIAFDVDHLIVNNNELSSTFMKSLQMISLGLIGHTKISTAFSIENNDVFGLFSHNTQQQQIQSQFDVLTFQPIVAKLGNFELFGVSGYFSSKLLLLRNQSLSGVNIHLRSIIFISQPPPRFAQFQSLFINFGNQTASSASCPTASSSSTTISDGFVIDGFTFKGTTTNSYLLSFSKANTTVNGLFCLYNIDLDISISSVTTSIGGDNNFNFFETYPKSSSEIPQLRITYVSFPLAFGIFSSKIAIRCASATSSSSSPSSSCAFSESDFSPQESRQSVLNSDFKNIPRKFQIHDSSFILEGSAKTKNLFSFLWNSHSTSAAKDVFDIFNTTIELQRSTSLENGIVVVSSGGARSLDFKIENSTMKIDSSIAAASERVRFVTSPSSASSSSSCASSPSTFSFVNTKIDFGTRNAEKLLSLVNMSSSSSSPQQQALADPLLLTLDCFNLNSSQLCPSSSALVPHKGDFVKINYCPETTAETCGKWGNNNNETNDSPSSSTIDKSLYEFAGKSPPETVEALSATTNAITTLSSFSGNPTVAMVAGRGLALTNLIGCPQAAPSGKKWSETSLSYPDTFLPFSSFGIGSSAEGYYRRSAIVSFIIAVCVVLCLAVAFGYYKHSKEDKKRDAAPKSHFIKYFVMKGLSVVLAQIIVPFGEHAALLMNFTEGGVDGALIFVFLISSISLLSFIGYSLTKQIIFSEKDRESSSTDDEKKSSSSKDRKSNKKQSTKSSGSATKKAVDIEDEITIDDPAPPAKLQFSRARLEFAEDINESFEEHHHHHQHGGIRGLLESRVGGFLFVGDPVCWAVVSTVPAMMWIQPVVRRTRGPVIDDEQHDAINNTSNSKKNPSSSKSNNKNKNKNKEPITIRTKMKNFLSPFYFIMMATLAFLVGFLTGFGKLNSSVCPTMTALIATVNTLSLLLHLILFPIQNNVFLAYLNVGVEFSTALASILISAFLNSPSSANDSSGFVSFLDKFLLITVSGGAMVISVCLFLSIAMMNLSKAALVPVHRPSAAALAKIPQNENQTLIEMMSSRKLHHSVNSFIKNNDNNNDSSHHHSRSRRRNDHRGRELEETLLSSKNTTTNKHRSNNNSDERDSRRGGSGRRNNTNDNRERSHRHHGSSSSRNDESSKNRRMNSGTNRKESHHHDNDDDRRYHRTQHDKNDDRGTNDERSRRIHHSGGDRDRSQHHSSSSKHHDRRHRDDDEKSYPRQHREQRIRQDERRPTNTRSLVPTRNDSSSASLSPRARSSRERVQRHHYESSSSRRPDYQSRKEEENRRQDERQSRPRRRSQYNKDYREDAYENEKRYRHRKIDAEDI